MILDDLLNNLADLLEDTALNDVLPQDRWGFGLPPDAGDYPCVRFDGFMKNTTELGYTLNLNLWAKLDDAEDESSSTLAFIELAEALQTLLDSSEYLTADNYMLRPEPGLHRALYRVRFYP